MLTPLSLEYRRACLKQDRERVSHWLRRIPAALAKGIRRQHNKILFSDGFKYDGDARRAANLHVQDCRDHFSDIAGRLNLNATDKDLCEEAKETADYVQLFQRIHKGKSFGELLELLRSYLAERDVYLHGSDDIPDGSTRLPKLGVKGVTAESIFARLIDETFWRKVFRKGITRKVETEAIRSGLVNQKAGLYVSDETLARFRGQRCRNRALLEGLLAFNELGQQYTLAELADLSVSNPDIRRAELMTRIAGFETIARTLGHAGLFLTITCPSRFHAFRKISKRKVIANKKYCGATPRQAQQYLSGVFARIRAELHRRGIAPYGFRVAEPHHDGTPHWHLLLFVSDAQSAEMVDVFADYATREDKAELGNDITPRFKCKEIDWSRGTAAGYIIKYVCKNIDGFKSNGEPIGKNFDDVETPIGAERVLAWAWCWGHRQFQQIGVAPATYWRECRRLFSIPGIVIDSDIIMRAAMAADAGDWAEFVRILGGTGLRLADLPFRLSRETSLVNRYGEEKGIRILGLVDIGDGLFVRTRIHEWSVEFAPKCERSEPWTRTRVNNCTSHAAGGTPAIQGLEQQSFQSRLIPRPSSEYHQAQPRASCTTFPDG